MASSKVYTFTGQFEEIVIDGFDGQCLFKKMTRSKVELEICRLLMKHPHKNLVTIYEVSDDYVIMENLNVTCNLKNISSTMESVKDYLQSIGVVYIDWKRDNMGISADGHLKLFDFDVSGTIDLKTQNWIIEALPYYAYTHSILDGFLTPLEIDNYAFKKYLLK